MKRKITVRFGLTCIVLLLIAACPLSMLINNIALDRFARQLDAVSASEGVEVLERKQALGGFTGNGDRLDFVACLLIRADLPADQLRAALSLPDFQSAKWGASSGVNAELLPVSAQTLRDDPIGRAGIAFDAFIPPLPDYAGYYILVLQDSGYDASLEPRAH